MNLGMSEVANHFSSKCLNGLVYDIITFYFFPLMEKRSKKDQGKPNRSARFAGLARLLCSLLLLLLCVSYVKNILNRSGCKLR